MREYSGVTGKEAIPHDRGLLVRPVAPWTKPTHDKAVTQVLPAPAPASSLPLTLAQSLVLPDGTLPACLHAFPVPFLLLGRPNSAHLSLLSSHASSPRQPPLIERT